MKHIIIGTAGHIDHGKTTLIKALTGKETDTLREEKERGISINLGFTFFDLPSGKRAGIIDVPGHEKFIKNMLAGVSGIDMVLLVIAADEGIMPQTREHFEILQLLNIKKGIVVLTKIDMVDDDWLSMVKEDVSEEFKGTFLENAPIIPVSSKTGAGIKELISEIDKAAEQVEAKDTEGHFRLPVDRSFSISGFGTVVTGTVISGKVQEGDAVEIYPSKTVVKVRGIQVHDKSVKFAEAGQRTALNLANIKSSQVKRGDVISVEKLMEPSMMLDCRIYYLKSASKPLENRQRVRLYHGTSEILCRIILLDKEIINPGESGFVQLRLEKPLTSQRNDRFVIRSYSPMHTIGGGTIIEPAAKKAKQFDKKYLADLMVKESGKIEDILESTVDKLSSLYPERLDILKALGKNVESIDEKLNELVNKGKIIALGNSDKTVYVHKNFLNLKAQQIKSILEKFHNENELLPGISKEEIKTKVFGKNLRQKVYDELLEILKKDEIIDIHNNYICLFNFKIIYSKEQQNIKEYILNSYSSAKYAPPKYEELDNGESDKKTFKKVFDSLILSGELVKVSEECILEKNCYEEAKKLIYDYIKKNGSITAAQWRDLLNTSRKYAVALLENFDSIKLTKRIDDKRVLQD
ncbi:selenocysteine-specific translation elongation factor [Clostridium sp. JN-9]|uniref:selenocysteine-specific translation elongation factor n=1 Tax=Clostridium sp. JN-9 TaxID=2507159 RepID=UPI000FFE07FB|nr:selenocysteine-specific translation elongation factor [Clostridium sp. JN-9]QAT39608.1 selenocysteine-specific translation elongation factor [Clostridium sp. JN-9]